MLSIHEHYANLYTIGFSTFNIFQEPDSPVTTKQIADFANKLKEKVKNNLKVGMIIPGSKYQQFSNNAGRRKHNLSTHTKIIKKQLN